MHSRPFGNLGRILLAGCALGLGATIALAQSSSSSSATSTTSTKSTRSSSDQSPSRMDVFLGYSYLAPHGNLTIPDPYTGPGTTFTNSYSSINAGAIGSFAYYFNRYVGGQVEFAVHPDGANDGAGDLGAGLIFRYPMAGMTPFAHALVGAVRLGGPNGDGFAHAYTTGTALTAGGGLDYELPFWNHRFALRLFQADFQYYHVNYGTQPFVGGRANIDAARLSTGLVMHFGSLVPPPPVAYSCTASPDSVYPGEQVTVTCTPSNLNPKKKTTYSWSGQGLTVSGTNSTTTIDTTNLQPGDYTATGHVSQGPKAGQSADASAHFTVKQFEPPTVSCTANPTTVQPGGTSTITATGVSPQNRTLTYSYSASAGSISGTSNSATLSTTGAPSGTITVTCNVSDDKGQTASSTTTVDVEAPPPPPAPKTQTLCSITFNKDKRRPTRVDNEAKACLDDVALNAQQKPDATVVLVGNSAPTKTPKTKWEREHWPTAEKQAAQRAVNTKAYLVSEKGIDASRIQVRTGTSGQNEVDDYLVPAGANFDNDVPGTTAVDESQYKAQPRNPVHHHYRHHHHKAAASGASK
jgi:outer membrane protein OmpA-like peptidoglycan-associated protein